MLGGSILRFVKRKEGQFILLAAVILAIMIVSIGVILYGTVTYFRHERWQEYLMIIDNVELGSQRVVELSLANYTLEFDPETLTNNLTQWQRNLIEAYPGFGVALSHSDATVRSDTKPVDSLTNVTMYFSSANATFNLDVNSVGLTGYKFVASAFLGVILNATYEKDAPNDLVIFVAVEKEDSIPVTNLDIDSFLINGSSAREYDPTLSHFYQEDSEDVVRIIYRIVLPNDPSFRNVRVEVVDPRGIRVRALTKVKDASAN